MDDRSRDDQRITHAACRSLVSCHLETHQELISCLAGRRQEGECLCDAPAEEPEQRMPASQVRSLMSDHGTSLVGPDERHQGVRRHDPSSKDPGSQREGSIAPNYQQAGFLSFGGMSPEQFEVPGFTASIVDDREHGPKETAHQP
jgi:hypothetical protein